MNGRLTIRPAFPAVPGDAASISRIYQPYVTRSVSSFEEDAPGPGEIERRMLARPRLPWLVGTRGGHVTGYCYASRHRSRPAYRWSADVSVYLDEAERGRGSGRLLYKRLLSEVRALGYVSVFAGITLPNEASVRLHQSMGFVPVGVFRNVGFKHGRWRDVGWWQCTLITPPPAEPNELRAWQSPDGA